MKLFEVFKEESGKLSFSRVFSGLIIVVYLFLTVTVTLETKQIPDIPDNLYWLILSIYGVNRATKALEKRLHGE